jgi:thiol-disulfide isomerase/thioredoxin
MDAQTGRKALLHSTLYRGNELSNESECLQVWRWRDVRMHNLDLNRKSKLGRRMRCWIVILVVVFGAYSCSGQEKPTSLPRTPVETELSPGDPKSKLAPNYSPKGRQFPLIPSERMDLPGSSPLEARLTLGGNPGDGHLLVLLRSAPDKPYDRLYVDLNHDGELNEAEISCEPKVIRGSTWSSFEATLELKPPAEGNSAGSTKYPISLWVVAEDPAVAPELIRISRRGFWVGEVKLGEQLASVIVSDSNNDGIIRQGDWWELRTTPPGKTKGSREIGDFHWGGGQAWKLEFGEKDFPKGRLLPHDPQMTEEEDAVVRDHLREDRLAVRAKEPVAFRKDADAAIEQAVAGKKPYFIKFETEWCGPCKTMSQLVFTAQAVADAAKEVTCIVVDGDERKDLTEKLEVKSYPTGILFDAEGKELARYVGYQSVKQTSEFLQKAASGR